MNLLTNIKVGARGSKLSKVQVEEVLLELNQALSKSKEKKKVTFTTAYMNSIGDKDQKTSLRDMGKNDFFTKEIDEAQVRGEFSISIHSAKDLPENLKDGLVVFAITKGVDSRDALVMKEGMSLESLPSSPKIATSSFKRDAAVRAIKSDAQIVDIRGPVDERLKKLHSQDLDGVVMAEAALIRLKENPNRIYLDSETTALQGQLAVIGREGDHSLQELFAKIDTRNKPQ